MKKFTVMFLATILIFGSFEICNAANFSSAARGLSALLNSSRSIRGIKAINKASDIYDASKIGATLLTADTSELAVQGVELGKTRIEDIEKQWKRAGEPEVQSNLACFYYHNRTVVVMTDLTFIAKAIACEGNEYIKTKRGIHCGSTLQDVFNAYGTNYEMINDGNFDVYMFSFNVEENILDRAYNFFKDRDGRVGKILFVVNKYSSEVVGLCTALVGNAEFGG